MCKCTPGIKTPFCGKPGCAWPEQPPSKDQLSGLISRILGERCADYDANCMTCRAWQMFDALRGVQSCSTREACRGAATLALGGAAPVLPVTPSNQWGIDEAFRTLESLTEHSSAAQGAMRFLRGEIARRQARIDALMLEFCPGEC